LKDTKSLFIVEANNALNGAKKVKKDMEFWEL